MLMQLLGVKMSRSPLFACGKDIKIAQSCPRGGMLLYRSVDVHLESIKFCQDQDVGVGVGVGAGAGVSASTTVAGMTLLDPEALDPISATTLAAAMIRDHTLK
jgi:hypothetical protein